MEGRGERNYRQKRIQIQKIVVRGIDWSGKGQFQMPFREWTTTGTPRYVPSFTLVERNDGCKGSKKRMGPLENTHAKVISALSVAKKAMEKKQMQIEVLRQKWATRGMNEAFPLTTKRKRTSDVVTILV